MYIKFNTTVNFDHKIMFSNIAHASHFSDDEVLKVLEGS